MLWVYFSMCPLKESRKRSILAFFQINFHCVGVNRRRGRAAGRAVCRASGVHWPCYTSCSCRTTARRDWREPFCRTPSSAAVNVAASTDPQCPIQPLLTLPINSITQRLNCRKVVTAGGWGRNFSKYWLCTVACENLQRDCMQAYTSELHEQNLQSRNRLY